MTQKSAMASSPSDPINPDTEAAISSNPSLIDKSSVAEQGTISLENANSSLNLESTQDEETKNLQYPEHSDARNQQLEALIEGNRNEEGDTDASQAISSSFDRRGGGPKPKKLTLKKRKQQEKAKEKFEVLLKTLKPIAFVPSKTLDFARHEKLLKILGLWDFVHLEFDQNIRQDLVAKLVAFYSSKGRCSYVNDSRIKISRADLARALRLPEKKDLVITEEEKELLENDESVRFIDEFLSTWVLLQRDDVCIMPVEVVEFTKDINQKHLEKLDWPTLLWFMVKKELNMKPPPGDCYFASHLQLLIKTQKEDLLRETSKVDDDDDDVKEVDSLVKSPKEDCLEVEEDVGAVDPKRDDGATNSKEDNYVEEHMVEVNLGQETMPERVSGEEEQGPVELQRLGGEVQRLGVEVQPLGVEENKKEEDERWTWNVYTHVGSQFLGLCNIISATEGDKENHVEGSVEMGEDEPIEDVGEEETEEDKEKHEEGFPFFPSSVSLHGVDQGNLMLGDASPLGYNPGLQIHGNSIGGDFLASRTDMHMAVGSGSSSMFGNGNKREITYHSHNPDSKRLRTKEPSWNEKPPADDMCLDQITYWTEKARLSLAEKDREREESVMNQQYLMNDLQNKTAMIQELERTKFEEVERRDEMIYKLETELHMMTSVVEGYRKALKLTKKASREHKKRCPLRDDKPVYKDVKGSGGLVLSITEIEKLRLKQEEEDKVTRVVIERQIEEFGSHWLKESEEHMETVESLNERFIEIENEVKNLRETVLESKNREMSEVAAPTEEI